jgi:YaiO family outer membrane protein
MGHYEKNRIFDGKEIMNFKNMFILLCIVMTQLVSGEDRVQKARNLAADKQYAGAHTILDSLLDDSPSDVDALLLKGLIFSWQHSYDSARIYLHKVIARSPDYRDAWQGIINTWKWENQPDSLRYFLQKTVQQFPHDSIFQHHLTELNQPGPHDKTALKKAGVTLGYRSELLDITTRKNLWHMLHLELMQPLHRFSFVTRLQGTRRSFGTTIGNGASLTEQLYFHMTNKTTLELLAGFSPYVIAAIDTVLPRLEFGGGVSHDFDGLFVLGIRGNFRNYGEINSSFFALSIQKYLKNILLSNTNYFAFDNSTLFYSGTASFRWYVKRNQYDYFAIKGGAGISPVREGGLDSGEFKHITARVERFFFLDERFGMLFGYECAGEQYEKNDPYVRMALECAFEVKF